MLHRNPFPDQRRRKSLQPESSIHALFGTWDPCDSLGESAENGEEFRDSCVVPGRGECPPRWREDA